MRNRFGDVYATYAMTYYLTMFMPYYFLNWSTFYSTKPYTMAFSNTPGLLKPLDIEGKKSLKMQNYVMPSGHTGIALSCLSYVDYIKIGCVTDDAIMKDPQHLVDMLEDNMRALMKLGQERAALSGKTD